MLLPSGQPVLPVPVPRVRTQHGCKCVLPFRYAPLSECVVSKHSESDCKNQGGYMMSKHCVTCQVEEYTECIRVDQEAPWCAVDGSTCGILSKDRLALESEADGGYGWTHWDHVSCFALSCECIFSNWSFLLILFAFCCQCPFRLCVHQILPLFCQCNFRLCLNDLLGILVVCQAVIRNLLNIFFAVHRRASRIFRVQAIQGSQGERRSDKCSTSRCRICEVGSCSTS